MMNRKILGGLLAASLLLAGCGAKEPAPAPAPAPVETQGPAADPAPAETQTTSTETQEPAAEPAPEETVQPEEPTLPGEDAADGISASYVGAWRDEPRGTSGGRCFMEIACPDGENYAIDIWWGSSAAETTHWQYTGTYDETWKGIDYIGTKYRETTQADGTVEQTAELEEATGLLYLEDGDLLWEDTFEHTGDGMRFQKES